MIEIPLKRSLSSILARAASIEELRQELRKTTSGLGILFVDLVGSTELKHQTTQDEWLPVVARFLFTVSNEITKNGGVVVKYIGDEVMAVFPSGSPGVVSINMEASLWNIQEQLASFIPASYAKYSFDYGEAAEISFEGFPEDYLGSAIDRCARIAKIAKRGNALASESYVSQSKNPKSWRRIGSIELRGFPIKQPIYQLEGAGESITNEELSYASKTSTEMIRELRESNERLRVCMEELKVQRQL